VAVGLGRGGVVTVHLGAGPGWRRDGLLVPCRRAWREGLGEVRLHGNTTLALRALAALTLQNGVVGVRRMVGLGQNCFGELIQGVEGSLAAR
jgi:hypothetical protein